MLHVVVCSYHVTCSGVGVGSSSLCSNTNSLHLKQRDIKDAAGVW